MYNVMLISGVHHSDSIIYILYVYIYMHMYILFQIFFYYRLLQNIEYSSLWYTVGPCWQSIVYILIPISQFIPLHHHCFPPSNHKFVFYSCDSICVL